MKTGVTIWAFPGGLLGRTRVDKAAGEALAAGFDGLDVSLTQVGDVSLRSKPAQWNDLRQKVSEAGSCIQSVSTLLLHDFPLTSGDPERAQTAIRIGSAMLEAAAALEAPTAALSPGHVNENDSYADCYQRALEQVGELSRRAEELGVTLCIENVVNRFLLSPLEAAQFFDAVGSPALGFCLDTGNARLQGYPEQWIDVLGSRIRKVHATDLTVHSPLHAEFTDVGEGDVDWTATLAGLRKIGYDGPLIAELFASDKRPYTEQLQINGAALRRLAEAFHA